MIHSDIKDFVYITMKLQARMHDSEETFYGVQNTVKRIESYLFVRINDGSEKSLKLAKDAVTAGFNRLKDEENLPIVCDKTIEQLSCSLEDKLHSRNVS
jgi:hypothetical protein